MSYEYKSIREVLEMIGNNEIYLPAIQRKFVWKYSQIESLFDSIMRGYPIGTFFFWYVRGNKKNEYTFYKFLQDYHARDRYLNDIAPKPELREEIIGVLDGQQRLSSMYISLQGTYAYKRPYAKWNSPNAFPERKFYLNLFKPPLDKGEAKKDEEDVGEEDFVYEFKFLTEEEAKKTDKKHFWFLVKEVLIWGEDPALDEYYDNLLEKDDLSDEFKDLIRSRRPQIKKVLRILHQRLAIEKLISYYKITEQELDNILDIFVRVNSGGTVLSKTDLLFSTIVANWEKGRGEIEKFLQLINSKGDGFWFNTDFIMRACLVLTDCPVLFKVKTFKKENIKKIKIGWHKIKSAISKVVDLLVEFGFSGEKLPSQMAVIPIAYHYFKGGSGTKSSKLGLKRYLIHSLIKQIYGGQGDLVLSNIRGALRKRETDAYILKYKDFEFSNLLNTKLPGNKSLKIREEDIEEILEYKKGSYTFMVLSLLYPNLKFSQIQFHQDHIHPASLFTDAKLKKCNIPEDRWAVWQEIKDMLPNLQLLEGRENESKNKTPFRDWLYGKDIDGNTNIPDVDRFKRDNYIPKNVRLEFKDFHEFYKERKEILREKVLKVLS